MKPLVIEDGGFRIEQVDIGLPFWDLYVNKVVSHKDGTKTSEWKAICYGTSIQGAIETIINCRMTARKARGENPDTPLTLKEFFDSYKEERSAVNKAFNLASINLTKDLLKLQEEINNESK